MARPKAQAAVDALRCRGAITPNQMLILKLHTEGKSAREIADELGYSGKDRLRRARRMVHRAFSLVIKEIRRQEHEAHKARKAAE
jgi:hypothetical protein